MNVKNPTSYLNNPQKYWEKTSREDMIKLCEQKRNAFRTRVTFEVEEIRGICPVYGIGDKVVIDSDICETINLQLTDQVCMSLIDNMHYRTAWTRLRKKQYDHLTVTNGECRTICNRPGPPYTPCGGVIFKITRVVFD